MNSNEKRPDRLVGFLNVATYFAPMALLVLTGFFRLLDTIGAVNTDAGLIRALGDMAGTLLLLPILFALLGFYNLFAGLTCRAYGLEGRFVERHRFTAAALSLLLAFFLLHEARPTLEPLWTLAGFVAMLAGMAPLTRARPIQVLFLVLLAPLLWIITGFEFVLDMGRESKEMAVSGWGTGRFALIGGAYVLLSVPLHRREAFKLFAADMLRIGAVLLAIGLVGMVR